LANRNKFLKQLVFKLCASFWPSYDWKTARNILYLFVSEGFIDRTTL